jgi:UDP-GlcNAc:undecaprenyl-phosphate/decaprenyl-phosphate GlcNAc-1-phosphate transferase
MIVLLVGFLIIPIVLSLVLTPLTMRIAHIVGAIDKPDERKIHAKPMPRIGGLAVVSSVFITYAIALAFIPSIRDVYTASSVNYPLLGAALALVFGLGVVDDIKQLKPGPKFLVQLVAASLVYLAGFRLVTIGHPFGTGTMLDLGWLEYPATVLWIVGVTNALNLIDGLDGLASGVALISGLTIMAVSLTIDSWDVAFAAAIMAGAVIGFLRYNFHPAKIFLGDSGSLFLGFVLATLSVQSSAKSTTVYTLLVPMFALGLPLLDTALAMTRRFLGPFLPARLAEGYSLRMLRSIFLPDRRHIHHQLMARGISHRRVVLMLYGISALLGVGAFLISVADTLPMVVMILVGVGLAMLLGIRKLNYGEIAVHRNGILLALYVNLYKWPILKRGWFQSVLDAFFALGALAATSLLWTSVTGSTSFGPTIYILVGTQILSFWVTGLYRETSQQLGMGDALRTLRSLVAAGLATGFVFWAMTSTPATGVVTLTLLDLSLLIPMAVMARFSFSMLTHFLQRDMTGKKSVLIFGANQQGKIALQILLDNDDLHLAPIGFLDNDPELEGKHLNGYKILGTHWKLSQILKRRRVDEIILPDNKLSPGILAYVQGVAQSHGVAVRRLDAQLVDVAPVPMNAPNRLSANVEERSKARIHVAH